MLQFAARSDFARGAQYYQVPIFIFIPGNNFIFKQLLKSKYGNHVHNLPLLEHNRLQVCGQILNSHIFTKFGNLSLVTQSGNVLLFVEVKNYFVSVLKCIPLDAGGASKLFMKCLNH